LAGFDAADLATAGIGASFAGAFQNPDLAFPQGREVQHRAVDNRKLPLRQSPRRPGPRREEALRLPTCHLLDHIGVVIKYAEGAVLWGAGAKLGCVKSAASLALEYTQKSALVAIVALPECDSLKSKFTMSASWQKHC
jgi:hypothetical protein